MKKYQIILLILLWVVIDKSYKPPTWCDMERWSYTIQNEQGERGQVEDFDGTIIVGDQVEFIQKQQGWNNYVGLKRK